MNRNQAVTVLELMVAVSVALLLGALLFPALKSYKERSKTIQCLSNIRGIGNALLIYATENSNKLPGLTEDNIQVEAMDGTGTVDIRFELEKYDGALWNIICPSDPLGKTNPDPANPVFVSYVYLPSKELDLAKAEPNLYLVRDRGFFHTSAGGFKSGVVFADNHVEMIRW